MAIGTNLKKLRNRTKLSQQEIADMLNLDRSTYINWENETSDVKSQYIPKLAEIFKVGIEDLFNEEKKIQINNNFENKDNAGGVGIQKGSVVINIVNLSDKESSETFRKQLEDLVNKINK